jgi:GT2 family glycosyltransferase
MRASLVVASHNEGDLLWKTVKSCVETMDGLDCEIVVADDASDDGSVDRLLERFAPARVVAFPSRRGVSPTKDLGGRSARGDVLIFLDGHCKPEPGAIERMIEAVEGWDGAAVVTPRVASLDIDTWELFPGRVGDGFWTEMQSFRMGWLRTDQLDAVEGPDGRGYFRQPSLIGCCLAVSRSLYERLRGFDTGMLSYGSEDIDFGFKSWMMGHPMVLDSEAVVGHRFRKKATTYSAPLDHGLLNVLRMARKMFGEDAWNDWVPAYRAVVPPDLWSAGWNLFKETRDDIEQERDYLMANRVHDEYWYAADFGQMWPLTLPGSPYPIPERLTLPASISAPGVYMSSFPQDSPEPGGTVPTGSPAPPETSGPLPCSTPKQASA